ncbi:hypothetical protein M3Y99_01428900 [Aphelenchoides fujianensis]|nr:hypothetical protein M3Y99_01428900 [Aphelenchoides fujianensis]
MFGNTPAFGTPGASDGAKPAGGFNPAASSSFATPTFNFNKPSTTIAALSLFGGQTATTSTSGGGLFGGIGGGAKPAAAPAGGLFGSPAPAATSTAPLFGQPSAGGSSLFGKPATSAAPSASLFGGPQPATPARPGGGLFGGIGSSTPAAAPSPGLFASPAPAASTAPSLFGQPAGGTSNLPRSSSLRWGCSESRSSRWAPRPPPQSSIFGTPGAAKPAGGFNPSGNPPFDLGVPGQRATQKTQPMDQEVPAALVQLLEGCRNKLKENADHLAKLDIDKPSEAYRQAEAMSNANVHLNRAWNTQTISMAAAQEFMAKVRSDTHDTKVLAKIPNDAKLRPGQANDTLSDLLAKTGRDLEANVDKLKEKIAVLEAPLREYLDAKEGLKAAKSITKQEIFDHIDRTVAICDNLYMNITSLHDRAQTLACIDPNASFWNK